MICYEGPLKDYSGYGEANRHAIAALDAAGVDVCGKLLKYTSEPSDFGTIGQVVDRLLEKQGKYRIKIMHTTPDEFKRLIEPDVYHIAHFFWETDKVPKTYVDGLNLVDEIWTGSQANYDAMIKGGVIRPIKIYPQAIETERAWPKPYVIDGFDGFLFYSIFEWTDRKNPEALVRAYYEEFTKRDHVGLLLKTYFRNFTFTNKKTIRSKLAELKAQYGEETPPVYAYLDLMDRQQIMRLHKTGSCYVSPHRGEGWGIPIAEAMLAGNPVITTGYGGVSEYLTDKTAYKLDYKLIPLKGMNHSGLLYDNDQNWADVSIQDIRRAMREAYEARLAENPRAEAGKKFVEQEFNLKTVGKLMADRLREVEASL